MGFLDYHGISFLILIDRGSTSYFITQKQSFSMNNIGHELKNLIHRGRSCSSEGNENLLSAPDFAAVLRLVRVADVASE